jgi:hypothetical protein
MKKWILGLLLISLMIGLCPAALADADVQLRPGQKDALREAGREYEDLLAMGSDEDFAVTLARSGVRAMDGAGWNGEDTWRVAVRRYHSLPSSPERHSHTDFYRVRSWKSGISSWES